MTFSFFTKLDFNGQELNVELEADIIDSGFHYEHFGNKGFKSEQEISSIMVISPLEDKELEFVEDQIAEGAIDNLVWAAHEKEISS